MCIVGFFTISLSLSLSLSSLSGTAAARVCVRRAAALSVSLPPAQLQLQTHHSRTRTDTKASLALSPLEHVDSLALLRPSSMPLPSPSLCTRLLTLFRVFCRHLMCRDNSLARPLHQLPLLSSSMEPLQPLQHAAAAEFIVARALPKNNADAGTAHAHQHPRKKHKRRTR